MRINSLKILKKDSDIIRNIKFNKEGLNLIVDNSDKSGNNVGKTTVLRLIDICLGAKEKKYIYTDDETNSVNAILKKYIEEEKISVILSVEKNENIIDLKVELYDRGKRYIDNKKIKYDNYKNELKSIFFNSSSKKPTFRQLIGKFVRIDQKQDNNRFIRYINNTSVTNEDYKGIYSFLFGLSDEKNINIIAEKTKELNEVSKSLKVIKKVHNFKSEDELKQKKFILEDRIRELNAKINEYIYLENDEELENKRLKIKEEYYSLIKEEEDLKFKIEKFKDIIVNEKEKNKKNKIDQSIVRLLYEEVSANYNDLDKTFDELVKFNDELSRNKINFYEELSKKESNKLSKILKIKENFLKTNKEYLQDFKINNLEEYYKIKREYDKNTEQKGGINEILEKLKILKEKEIKLKEEIEENKEENVENSRYKNAKIFNNFFSEYSKKVEGEELFMYFTDDNIPSISNIDNGVGTGTKKTLISIFDLAYYSFFKDLKFQFPEFVIHDVLETSQTESLEKIIEIIKNIKIQYIAAVLNEKIKNNKNIKKADIILELNKEDKLFKI